MQQFDNTNFGALFKNDKKTEDKHPDLRGEINIEGVMYWISGWSRVSKAGQKFISIGIRKKQEDTRQISKPTTKAKAKDFGNDDIPW